MGLERPFQPAPGEPAHNASSINWAGLERDQVKAVVYASADFTAVEKSFLAWMADKSFEDGYTICIQTAKDELKLGRYAWVSARTKLEQKGILVQTRVLLPNGSSHWTLDIDLEPLAHIRARDLQVPADHDLMKPAHYPIKNTPAAAPKGAAGGNVLPASSSQPAVQPPPPPEGAGAVLKIHTDRIPNEKNVMNDEDQFFLARTFFDWLGSNGVKRVRLAAQTRKKDGQRGAPMGFGRPGKPIAEGLPVPVTQATDLAAALLARLQAPTIGKGNLELVTSVAEDLHGLSKALLLDDLREKGIQVLKVHWNGPGVILETSPGNFQAVLILAEPLARTERKSITDQLVELTGGDGGAKGAQQLHRIPGSVNYKRSLPEPFVCRAVEFFHGNGQGIKPVPRLTSASQKTALPAVAPGKVRPLRPLCWREAVSTPSEAAFRLAADMFHSGASKDQVVAALSSPEVLRGHDSNDWPERTAERARLFLAGDLYRRGGVRHA